MSDHRFTKKKFVLFLNKEYAKLTKDQILRKFYYLCESMERGNALARAYGRGEVGAFIAKHDKDDFDQWYADWLKKKKTT